ncbi:hypothetical protein VTL71DRAFT_7058, partial [Oculimacula yallundae]
MTTPSFFLLQSQTHQPTTPTSKTTAKSLTSPPCQDPPALNIMLLSPKRRFTWFSISPTFPPLSTTTVKARPVKVAGLKPPLPETVPKPQLLPATQHHNSNSHLHPISVVDVPRHSVFHTPARLLLFPQAKSLDML